MGTQGNDEISRKVELAWLTAFYGGMLTDKQRLVLQLHCEEDMSVNMQAHSDKLVEKLRALSHNVTYDTVPGRGHCKLTLEMQRLFAQYALDAIEKAQK